MQQQQTKTQQRLSDLRVQVKTLEEQCMRERLAGLHLELGFESTMALVTELRRSIKSAGADSRQRQRDENPGAVVPAPGGKRKRTVVTPAHRRAIGKDLRKGDTSDQKVADGHGVSLTTVQRIKGELGLQAKRKKKKKK